MEFKEAYRALKEGKSIKRKDWAGFWKKDDGIFSRDGKETILMFCKDDSILDIRDTDKPFFTLDNIVADDWEITNQDC